MSASLLDSARFRHAVQLAFRSNAHLLLEVEWAQDPTTRASVAHAPTTESTGTSGPNGTGFNFALTVAEAIDALVTDVRVYTVSCSAQTTIEDLMLPNSAPAGSMHPSPAAHAAHTDKAKSNSRLRNPDRRRASAQSMVPLPSGDMPDLASPAFSHPQAHPHAYQPVPSSYDILVLENLDRAPQQVQAAVLLALDRQAARLKRLQAQQRAAVAQQQRELNMVGVSGRDHQHSHGTSLGVNAHAMASRHGDGGGAALGAGAHSKRNSRLQPFENYHVSDNAGHSDFRRTSHFNHAKLSNMDGMRHIMSGMGVGRAERRVPGFQLIATTSRSGSAAAQGMAPPSEQLRHGSTSADNRENMRAGHARGSSEIALRGTPMLKRFCSEPVVPADYAVTPDHTASAAADPPLPPRPHPPPQSWQVHFYPGLADMFGISVALELMPSAAVFNDGDALEAEQQHSSLYGHHHRNPTQIVQAQARVRARLRVAAKRAMRRAPEHAQNRAFAADNDQASSVRSDWSGSVFGGVSLQAPSYTELADHATLVHTVHVSSAVRRVAQDLVSALRIHTAVVPPVLSASASAALIYAAQAVALTQNKHFVVPAHICSVASMVLRHRISVRTESGQTADMVVSDILERLPMPV